MPATFAILTIFRFFVLSRWPFRLFLNAARFSARLCGVRIRTRQLYDVALLEDVVAKDTIGMGLAHSAVVPAPKEKPR